MPKKRLSAIPATMALLCSVSWNQATRAATFFVDCPGGNEALVDAMNTANLSRDRDLIWVRGHCVFDAEYEKYGTEPVARLPPVTTPISIYGMGWSPATLEVKGSIHTSRRLFFVESSGDLRLTNLRIEGSTTEEAGAIVNLGSLHVREVTFLRNKSAESGGAVRNLGNAIVWDSTFQENQTGFRGGAIYNDGTLRITGSSFMDNADFDNGGAIFNDAGALTVVDGYFTRNVSEDSGAIDSQDGTVSIDNSLFLDNSGTYYGAMRIAGGSAYISESQFLENYAEFVGAGGVSFEGATAQVVETTISANSSGYLGTAALWSHDSSVLIDRCTISDNGPWDESSYEVSSIAGEGLTIVNSTLSGNRSVGDDGLPYPAITLSSSVLIQSTIWNNQNATELYESEYRGNILGNSTGGPACAFSNSDSTGFNLASDFSCDLESRRGDLPNTDPLLSPLGDHGGPTFTHLPASTSPALGSVPPGACGGPDGFPLFFDQRGVRRPRRNPCDIGAVER